MTQVKNKIVKLRDTSTKNFTMAIKIPNKDYSPKQRRKSKLLTKSEIRKRYRLKHPDRYKESKRKWLEENLEYHRAYEHEWYLKNRKRILKTKKEKYHHNKERPEGYEITKSGVKS